MCLKLISSRTSWLNYECRLRDFYVFQKKELLLCFFPRIIFSGKNFSRVPLSKINSTVNCWQRSVLNFILVYRELVFATKFPQNICPAKKSLENVQQENYQKPKSLRNAVPFHKKATSLPSVYCSIKNRFKISAGLANAHRQDNRKEISSSKDKSKVYHGIAYWCNTLISISNHFVMIILGFEEVWNDYLVITSLT